MAAGVRKLCVSDQGPAIGTVETRNAPEEQRARRQVRHLQARLRAAAALDALLDDDLRERLVKGYLEPVLHAAGAALDAGVVDHERRSRRRCDQTTHRRDRNRRLDEDRYDEVELGDARIVALVRAVVGLGAPVVRAVGCQRCIDHDRGLCGAGCDLGLGEHLVRERGIGGELDDVEERALAVGGPVVEDQAHRRGVEHLGAVDRVDRRRRRDRDAGNRPGHIRTERIAAFLRFTCADSYRRESRDC